MKKPLLFLLTVLAFIGTAKSQDLIVKNTNDSVRCKIIKQTEATVFFFTYDKNNVETTNALKKSDVKEIVLNFYADKTNDSTKITGSTSSSAINKNARPVRQIEVISGIRVSANYGAAYWIFLNPKGSNSFMKEYFNDLRTGNAYSFTFNHYGKKNYGIGFQYMNFMSKNTILNVATSAPNGSTQIGNLTDDINMQYVGVSFGYRMPLNNKKWRLVADFGIGYSDYVNNVDFITKSKIKATTIAVNTQLGFDCKISKTLSWGITGTLLRASTNSYEVTTGNTTTTVKLPNDESDSHMRADISVGLRINFLE